jgi:AcrR family transcriptional regulator
VTAAPDSRSQLATDRYHHGDLPNALRGAAVEVIEDYGLGRFSLREVARRAGVSHTAPAHHFGDVRGLLTSVAIEGFDTLYELTTRAAVGETDPAERIAAIGEAYVSLATSSPAHCQVMFRTDVVDTDDQRLMDAGLRAYGVLYGAVSELIAAEGLDADVDAAVELCWAATQGLVVIEPKLVLIDARAGRATLTTRERIRRLTTLMLDGIRHSAPTA